MNSIHCVVFSICYVRFFFKHNSIKQRNRKMNRAISNFSKINQKNNVTAVLRNNILQLPCVVFAICYRMLENFYVVLAIYHQRKNATLRRPKRVINVTVFSYFFKEIYEQEKNLKNSVNRIDVILSRQMLHKISVANVTFLQFISSILGKMTS